MATLSITKQWANGEVLLEADLDYIKSDIETFLNTTKINDDNIQAGGITGSTKLVDLSVTVGKLATDSVSTAKILDSNVTTAKIADLNVTYAKIAAAAIALLNPSGQVTAYAGTAAPTGWLLCDGSTISRTTYAALFTAIGTTYGPGDTTTTFEIPDLRGRVIAGQDDMGGTSANRLVAAVAQSLNGDTLGATGGAETHTLTVAESAAHDHSGTTGTASQYHRTFGNAGATGAAEPFTLAWGNGGDGPTTHAHSISSQGGGGAHNNVQPTIILNYIIKT
jgi:microcystin-dependent protein